LACYDPQFGFIQFIEYMGHWGFGLESIDLFRNIRLDIMNINEA